jgi:hypothetical protein
MSRRERVQQNYSTNAVGALLEKQRHVKAERLGRF